MAIEDHFKKLVDRSGFPLQIGLADLVRRTTNNHGYKTIYHEHAWRGSDGDSGFLDLVLEDRHGSTLLAVECKRVLESDWLFLQQGSSLVKSRTARGWVTYVQPGRNFVGWWDFTMATAAPQSQFCVVPKDDKAVPTLERIGSELVMATEALALEDANLRLRSGDSIRMYFSAVVTTAKLRVCSVEPSKINLTDGTTIDIQAEEVPVVMFRKQLSTDLKVTKAETPMQPSDIATAKEHTVFVVNANAFSEFLVGFDVTDESIRTFQFNR